MNYIQYLRQYVGNNPILTAGTALFVFNENKELLLQLRSDFNLWGVIGGCMELGESFEEVAKRELKEETGLEIEELKMIDVISGKETFRTYPNGDKLYDITAIYEVRKFSGELRINDDESKELKWFKLSELPSNITVMMKSYLKNNKVIKLLEEYR